MKSASKLELHYYFNDNSHSMDAYIRNNCETHLLGLIQEITTTLDIEVQIDSEALREGGIKNTWKFIGKNSGQLSVVIALIALVLQLYQLYSSEDEMDIELKELSIQEKRLNIEKLKSELNLGKIKNQTIEETASSLNNDFKVLTKKSNFFKQLDRSEKITKLGITSLDINNEPVSEEKIIHKNDFYKYILSTNKLPDQIIEDAEIEIISPVLREGKYQWKGIYNNQSIGFSMLDNEFKSDVLARKVSFQNGSRIKCELKISQELDESGEVVIKGYSVNVVIENFVGEVSQETPQGKRHKHNKKQYAAQIELELGKNGEEL